MLYNGELIMGTIFIIYLQIFIFLSVVLFLLYELLIKPFNLNEDLRRIATKVIYVLLTIHLIVKILELLKNIF